MDPLDATITDLPAATPADPATPAAETDTFANFDAELSDLVSKSVSTTVQPSLPPGEEPAGETPAAEGEQVEGEPAKEEPAETEKPAAAAKPADKLTQRLALVADGARKNETRAKDLDGRELGITTREQTLVEREGKLKADVELLDAIRTAPSKVARIEAIVGGEDQLRDLYLELTDHFNGAPPRSTATPKPAAGAGDIEKLVRAEVDKRMADADASRSAEAQKVTAEAKAGYVRRAHSTLEASAGEFPFCFAAPPSSLAITAISDEILKQTGEVPPVETVLKMIEDERQARHQKAASKTPAAAKPATSATPAEQTRGAAPSRRTSVPVTTPRVLTFEEELAKATAKLTGNAS
jgi:hypothetical protein